MGVLLTVGFRDVNGRTAGTRLWIDDAGNANNVIQALADLSNAQIYTAHIAVPVDLLLVTNNAPVAANMESVTSGARITMQGGDLGSTNQPFQRVTFNIPAPLGDLINGLTGNAADARLNPFKNIVQDNSGVSMTDVTRVAYTK